MKKIQMVIVLLVSFINIAWMWQKSKDQEYLKKGYAAWQEGNLNEAKTYFEKALSFKPSQVEAYNYLGVINEKFGRFSEAEEKYLTAIRLDRSYAPAYLNLGLLYWNQGDKSQAVYYLKKRIEMGTPTDEWVMKAQKALDTIQSSGGQVVDSKINSERQERLKLIDEELNKVKPLEPKPVEKVKSAAKETSVGSPQAQAFFSQGQQLASQGRYQEAIAAYDQALRITPGVPQIIKARVEAFLQWKSQVVNES